MNLIKAEFVKIFRMGWTYAIILTMNAFMMLALFFFLVLMAKTSAVDDLALKASEYQYIAQLFMQVNYILGSWIFSFGSFFLMSIFTGLTIGREFDSGSIEFFILSPFTRVKIFGAKVLGIFSVYFIAKGINTVLQVLAGQILVSAHPIFSPFVNLSVLGKFFLATVVADLAWISFVILVGMVSSGVATTVMYSLLGYFTFVGMDIVVTVSEHYENLIPSWLQRAGEYTFTASCNFLKTADLPKYILGAINELPLSYEKLSVTVVYGVTFLILAMVAFHYREV